MVLRLRLLLCLIAAPLVANAAPWRFPIADRAPWSYYDNDCRPAGIVVDLLREIGRRAELDPQFVVLPFGELQPALLDGRLDADINERNPWFDQHLEALGPLLTLEDVVIVHAGHEGRERLRLGHLRTYNSRGALLAEMDVGIVEFDDYASLAGAFLDGRLDAVAGIKETLLFHLYRQGARTDVLHTLRSLQSVAVWLYLAPHTPEETRVRLRRVIAEGDFRDLLVKSRSLHLGLHRLRTVSDRARCVP